MENISLEQKIGFKTVKFELVGNKEILLVESTPFSHRSVSISLSILEAKPFRYKNTDIRSYIFGGLSLAFTVFMLALAVFTTGNITLEFFIPHLLIFGTLSALLLRKAFKASSNLIVFTSVANGASVLFLNVKKKNESLVTKFSEEITKRINSIRYSEGLSFDQKYEIYSRHLEFLVNEEVISKEERDLYLKRINEKNVAKIVKFV